VAVDGMVFHEPVFVGDEVSCYGELVRTGRTSMTIRVEAWGVTCPPTRFGR
jgi:acyl-CoA thioesterase YciA